MPIVWTWSDREIEKPILLKTQLEDIQSKGFSGVLACLGETRYELTDRKVIRAAAQASQWAKKRGIFFWFQADPRQASRSFITLTGERTQNLLMFREHLGHFHPNLIRVRKNRFFMRIPYPKVKSTPVIREVPLHFEPTGLERTFLLQIENGKAVSRSLRDITSEARFFANEAKQYVEVFGEIQTPAHETWYVMAFPRFDTNLYDYAGRKSVDKLLPFIEALFDSGLYLDGISWSNPGYCSDAGRIPVSPSIFNSFIAEFGYDLRDRLPALVLDFDDASHIPVRHDYAALLLDAVSSAMKDFTGMLHAFFGDVETVMPSGFRVSDHSGTDASDPWQKLSVSTSGATEICWKKPFPDYGDGNLTALVEAKSLGAFSKSQRAYALLNGFDFARKELLWWMDLAALFSVQWLVQKYDSGRFRGKKSRSASGYPERPGWEWFVELNRYYDALHRITGFKFPEADTLLVLPFETLVTSSPIRAREMLVDIEKLVSLLVLNGAQVDTISSSILARAKLDRHRLNFQNRTYQRIIYPYPEIIRPDVLELVSLMERMHFPMFLGGTKPRYTTAGESILRDFPVSFDPKDKAFAETWRTGTTHIFKIPEGGLGSVIQTGTETLLLFCPKEAGTFVAGEASYRGTVLNVSKSDRLVIYSLKGGRVQQIL